MNINVSKNARFFSTNSIILKKFMMARPRYMVMTYVDKILRSGGYWSLKLDLDVIGITPSAFASVNSGDYDNWDMLYNVDVSNITPSMYSGIKSDNDVLDLSYNVDVISIESAKYAGVKTGSTDYAMSFDVDVIGIPLATYRATFIHSNDDIALEYGIQFSEMNPTLLTSMVGDDNIALDYSIGFNNIDGIMLNSIEGVASAIIDYSMAFNNIDEIMLGSISSKSSNAIMGDTSTEFTLDILSDSSCVALFPLNSSAIDISGNYTGTSADITYDSNGGYFNGTSSYAGNAVFPTPNVYSASVFFETSTVSAGWQHIMSAGDISLVLHYGTLYMGKYGSTLKFPNIQINTRYHVMFTHNLTTDLTELWVNGQKITTGSSIAYENSTSKIIIGKSEYYNTYYFSGKIDQVRVFNRILGENDIPKLVQESKLDYYISMPVTYSLMFENIPPYSISTFNSFVVSELSPVDTNIVDINSIFTGGRPFDMTFDIIGESIFKIVGNYIQPKSSLKDLVDTSYNITVRITMVSKPTMYWDVNLSIVITNDVMYPTPFKTLWSNVGPKVSGQQYMIDKTFKQLTYGVDTGYVIASDDKVYDLTGNVIGTDTWKYINMRYDTPVGIKSDGTLWKGFITKLGGDTDWKYTTSHIESHFAIKNDGSLWCNKLQGTSLQRVGVANNWVQVCATLFGAVGVKSDGTLWGMHADGSPEVKISPTSDWKMVSGSNTYYVAVKTDGSIWVSYNWMTDPASVWTQISGSNNNNIKFVDCGYYNTSILKNDGSVWYHSRDVDKDIYNASIGIGYTQSAKSYGGSIGGVVGKI